MADNIEIVIGTYEQYLLGYRVKNTIDGVKLIRSFASHSHQASVRDVATSKHYLASSGADDSIYLYDMRTRIESGKLTHHNDTVNSIEFTPDSSHILTCSTDGSIAAVRCGNWKLEKHWNNAHKGSQVNSLCIHPSGKLALSVGGDGVLRTWNLVKGRQAYATNLVPKLGLDAKNITVVQWSPNGTKYLLATNFKLVLYSVENAGIIHEVDFDSKVTCVKFIDDDIVVIGHDSGQIEFYDTETSSKLLVKDVHNTRVKTLAIVGDIIATASSSGELKLWRFTVDSLDLLATEHCGARITCLLLTQKFAEPEVKQEVVTVSENEVKKKKNNVFKIRQEVIVEDEGQDENNETSVKAAGQSLKKSKRKSKKKTNLPEDVQEQNDSSQNIGKKSKHLKKNGSLNAESKKKKKKTIVVDNQESELKSMKRSRKSELNTPENIESKNKTKKRKINKEELDNTIDLATPKTKKGKSSVTLMKPATKVIKRKVKKFKKTVK